MSKGSRISAVETLAAADGASDEYMLDQVFEQDSPAEPEDWWEAPAKETRNWPFMVGAALAVALLLGWTALFVASNLHAMRVSRDLPQWKVRVW